MIQINKIECERSTLNYMVEKIVNLAKVKLMDLQVDIGEFDSFQHTEIENAYWKYLIIKENHLFVGCT